MLPVLTLTGDRLEAELPAELAPLRAPRAHLRLITAGGAVRGWLDERRCILLARDRDRETDVACAAMATERVPFAVARRWAASDGEEDRSAIVHAPARLAERLAAPVPVLDGAGRVHGHWLLEAWPERRPPAGEKALVEVVEAQSGPWLVRPGDGDVTLLPIDRGRVVAALATLLRRVLAASVG